MTDVDDDVDEVVQEEVGDVEMPRWRGVAGAVTVGVVALLTGVLAVVLASAVIVATVGVETAAAHETASAWTLRAVAIGGALAGGHYLGGRVAERLWLTPLERRKVS